MRIDDGPARRLEPERSDQKAEIKGDAEKSEAGNEKAGHRSGAIGRFEPQGKRFGSRLRGAVIRSDRDVHADESCRSRQDGTNEETNGRIDVEENQRQNEDDRAHDRDRRVLPLQIRLRPFANGCSDFLHSRGAGIGGEQCPRRGRGINQRQGAAQNNNPERGTHRISSEVSKI